MLINEFISKYGIIRIDDIISEAVRRGFNEDEVRNLLSDLMERDILVRGRARTLAG